MDGGHPEQLNPENARALVLTNAIKSGNIDIVVEVLTTHNIDINRPIDGSWSPFLLASLHCQYDIMAHFLQLGANPLFAPNFYNALMAVCSSSCTDEELVARCARLLINQGLQINERDAQRTTALMLAARNGHIEVVKELIARNAIIDAQDYEGWSSIFYAVSQNKLEIVQVLIESGASVDLEDRRGRKIIDIAEVKGLNDIANLISKNMRGGITEEVPEVAHEAPVYLVVQSYKDMVQELPENNEFQADMLHFLHNLYLERYTRTFYDKKISLGTLLLMDEDDLKEAGVYLSNHRKLILSSAKKFHLAIWKSSCLNKDRKVHSDELAFSLANITRHLYALTQTTKYIKKHCDKNSCKVFNNEFQPIILKNIDNLNAIEKTLERVRNFGVALEKNDKVEYVDLINEKTLTTQNKVLSKFYMVYLPSAVLTCYLLRNKNLVPLLVRLFLNKVPCLRSFKFW